MTASAHAIDDRRRVDVIHSAIDRALSAFPQDVAHKARPLIRAMMAPRVYSGRPDAWGGSQLTGDGFPFELSLCTADHRLRFTAEPGRRDLTPEQRFDFAIAALQRCGASVPAHIVETCRAIHRNAVLNYGAWVGCRVSSEGHALKLYVEVPEAQRTTLPTPHFTLPDRSIVMRMLAYSSGGVESYVRVPSLEPRHLPAILAPAGLEDRAGELLEFLREAYGCRIGARVPGPSVGVSFTGTVSAPRVTVYLFARSLWGSDARIRRQFVRIASAYGWNPDTYLQVTAPIAARDSWQTYHGLFGVTLDRSTMSFAIGVRPVCA